MKNVLIFGGTIEGRLLVERLQAFDVMLHVCVVTEYGAGLLSDRPNICKHVGRLDETSMQTLITKLKPVCCVDATHPYAQLATENIAAVCEKTACPYIRLARDTEQENIACDAYTFACVADAAQFLATTEGNVFVTTGSKELDAYAVIPDYENRVVARVLPTVEVLQKCKALGFEGRNLICMQGPFSEEMNYEMLRSVEAKWLVTKCTGAAGGYPEKCEAAIRAGVKLVLIGRPKENGHAVLFEQAVALVCSYIDVDYSNEKSAETAQEKAKKICLIGVGPGSRSLMTADALYAVETAEVLIGAKRMLEICDPFEEKEQFISYKPEEILDFIRRDCTHRKFGIVYSGDIGFYSGATKLAKCIEAAEENYAVEYAAGISSPIYLFDKLGMQWQDAVLVSNHGCETNIVAKIQKNRVVATLTGNENDIAGICQGLMDSGLEAVKVTVGSRLSYPQETIVSGKPSDFVCKQFDKLSVAIFENDKPKQAGALRDEDFIRGAVPMTKQEVRTLSVAKLGISKTSVVYDVGAGTGSVTVAMALAAEEGVVYAIEQKEEALQLIHNNAKKFGCTNVKVIAGRAPEIFGDLPAPTHVFIGGSGGNLIDIIETIRQKNKTVRFVVNAVTLETIAKLLELGNKYREYADMEITYVQISRGKQIGNLHLMTADNGIYIAAFGGKDETNNQ